MFEDVIRQYKPVQNPVELNKLFQFVNELQPKNIMVLGVDNGEIMRLLKHAFHPEILIGVDSHTKELAEDIASLIIGDPTTPEVFDQVVDKLTNKNLDLLILNHDKTFDGIKKEYFLYKDLVREGGIIAMDSIRLKSPAYHMAGIDVSDFWSSLIRDNRIKYFEFWDVGVNGYGPGIGMMYKI